MPQKDETEKKTLKPSSQKLKSIWILRSNFLILRLVLLTINQ